MVLFDLTVEKQNIHGADKIALAASANKTIALRFHFDRNWRDFSSKAAIFRNHAGEFYIIEIQHSVAVIPWEVLTQDEDVELSVIAYTSTDSSVLTTSAVTLTVSRSLLPEEYATKTASETIFDKFKRECTAQAFLDYEDELEAQKNAYEQQIRIKQEEIEQERQNTANAVAQKDAEIDAINLQNSQTVTALQIELASVNTQLAAMKIKADKWDLIDLAISKKTAFNLPLWGSAKSTYKLPDLNTSAVTAFPTNSIGSELEEIGLDVSSATSLSGLFQDKASLKKVRIYNSEKITSLNKFTYCAPLVEYVEIGNIPDCTSLSNMVAGCKFIETVKIGQNKKIQTMDYAFYACPALKEIDTVFDVSLCTNFSSAFNLSPSLEKVRFKENTISVGITFKDCINLTKESLQSIFNALNPDYHCSLGINKYNFYKNYPTVEEREEIVEFITETKGWTLSLS